MEESERIDELCVPATGSAPSREDDLQEQIDAVVEAVSSVAGAMGAVTDALSAVLPKTAAAKLAAQVQAVGDISQMLTAEGKE